MVAGGKKKKKKKSMAKIIDSLASFRVEGLDEEMKTKKRSNLIPQRRKRSRCRSHTAALKEKKEKKTEWT